MASKIPADAFDYYVSQGEKRSYQSTAEHYGVSKCAISKRAKREAWSARLAAIEAEARARSDRKLTDDVAEMRGRHAKMLQVMGVRVVNALRDHPLADGMDAMRAAAIVIRLERTAVKEAVERDGNRVEEVTRKEIALLVARDPQPLKNVLASAAGDAPNDGDADGQDDW